MKKLGYIALFGLVLLGCNKKKFFDGPNYFADGFETYSTLEEALPEDDVLWSFTQLTRSENTITVDTSRFHSGTQSLKFQAAASSDGDASKASIAKQNMAFWEGETMRVSAWIFIEGPDPLQWLFLFDVEEQTAIVAGPGMRLALVDDQLRVEHKFLEDDILQNVGDPVDFPRPMGGSDLGN